MSYDERGLMKWSDYFEKYVKPYDKQLDAYDATIIHAVHKRWSEERPYVDMQWVKDKVTLECGFLTDEEFNKRVTKLEHLAILVRMVRLN